MKKILFFLFMILPISQSNAFFFQDTDKKGTYEYDHGITYRFKYYEIKFTPEDQQLLKAIDDFLSLFPKNCHPYLRLQLRYGQLSLDFKLLHPDDHELFWQKLSKLVFLKFLDLRNCGFDEISPLIGELRNLEILDLSLNHLKELPNSIGALKMLRILNVSTNALIKVPVSLNKLKKLELLSLSVNKIQRLPDHLFLLPNLKYLDLWINPLKSLTPSIGNLKCLKWLNLAETKLQTLPNAMNNLKALQFLDLSNTPNLKEPKNLAPLFEQLKATEEKARKAS